MRIIVATSALVIASFASAACAQDFSESKVRDALLAHFGRDNLLPVFVARPYQVGDVLEPSGAIYARRADCFPTLPQATPTKIEDVRTVVLTRSAEGNFGLGLKRVVDILVKAGAASKTKMTITFEDQSYVGASSMDLRKHFSTKSCGAVATIIKGESIGVAELTQPYLVLQEVYSARKSLVVELDRSVDGEVVAKDMRDTAVSLGLGAEVKAGAAQGTQFIIKAKDVVPIAVRVAFIPRPVSGVKLGGSGDPDTVGYIWEPATRTPTARERDGFEVLRQRVEAATQGNSNPLLSE